MSYEPNTAYLLGKELYAIGDRESITAEIQKRVEAEKRDRNYYWRAYGHYRLFCKALGFGPEIFALGPERLDKLRGQIDWNPRLGTVGCGLGKKWSKQTARKRIKALLDIKMVSDE